MNRNIVTLDPSTPYALPTSSTAAPDAVAILQQPISGEPNFNIRSKPRVANVPNEFDLTFAANVDKPAAVPLRLNIVTIGFLGARVDDVLSEILSVSPAANPSVDFAGIALWYGYPSDVQRRRARTIRTAVAAFAMANSTVGDALGVIIRKADHVQIVVARAVVKGA